MAELVAAGRSVADIARELGVSKPTVCFHLRSLGVVSDSRFARRYDWATIRTRYEGGWTMKECQAAFGFSSAAWSEAVRRGEIDARPRGRPVDEIFAFGTRRNRFHLKNRLLNSGLKAAASEECGGAEWRGQPLPLELHHVNGDGLDNRIENLQLLCPNCHSLTDTWGGRNARRKAA